MEEMIFTVEEGTRILHVSHVIVGGSCRRPDKLEDLLAQALLNIRVLSEHVERECEKRARLQKKFARF